MVGRDVRRCVEATLEKIVSDAAADHQFSLYRLVNFRRGGSILESYAAVGNAIGAAEVDRICKEQLVDYVYNAGRGATVTRADCLTWRRKRCGEVSVAMSKRSGPKRLAMTGRGSPPSSSSGSMAPYDWPEDHVACWKLDQRGALGENPLHVLVICDTPTHTKVAKILLEHFPKLVNDVFEGSEYNGLGPLHLAVAYNNTELVQAFVQAGANVNERALGRFFMPADQKLKPKRRTNYEGLSYLGEYPLSWAACCENESMYNYLLDHGADPNLQDTFGNMILHMVVISNKLGMYGYALRHPKKPANNEILNKAGLTPLTLACVLGRNNIFREMLELSSVEFWRFSNITCSAYPLIALDTIGPDGGTNWKSALMIILNGETEEHLDMLEGGVVQRLLEDKWKTFARNQFLKRLGLLFLHLLVISIAVYLRPRFGESLGWANDPETIIRHCAELGTLLGCGIFVFVQQGSEIHSQGIVGFFTNLTRSPAKFIFLISNIGILLCIPCRLLHWRLVEDSLLTFALPGTWFFLMFFAGAVRLTGPFVTMIYSMIAGDMVRFGIIYFIMLMGFSQALYFLFKSCYVGARDIDDTNIDLYRTYWGTWMALYHMTLGSYQYSDFTKPKYSGLSMTIFVIFMVLVPILLLNMLIAMMGNTYANVISKSEKEFVKQWAKIVLALERSVSKKHAKEHLNAYAINLAPPPDSDPVVEMKGLMVIKCKAKTKAQQRKGALLNWRRMGKRVVGEMRRYGCGGEQLLVTMAKGPPKKIPQRGASFPGILDMPDLDSDNGEAPPAPKGGLEEALTQLAFAHDLDLGATSTPVFNDAGEQKSPSTESTPKCVDEILPSEVSVGLPFCPPHHCWASVDCPPNYEELLVPPPQFADDTPQPVVEETSPSITENMVQQTLTSQAEQEVLKELQDVPDRSLQDLMPRATEVTMKKFQDEADQAQLNLTSKAEEEVLKKPQDVANRSWTSAVEPMTIVETTSGETVEQTEILAETLESSGSMGTADVTTVLQLELGSSPMHDVPSEMDSVPEPNRTDVAQIAPLLLKTSSQDPRPQTSPTSTELLVVPTCSTKLRSNLPADPFRRMAPASASCRSKGRRRSKAGRLQQKLHKLTNKVGATSSLAIRPRPIAILGEASEAEPVYLRPSFGPIERRNVLPSLSPPTTPKPSSPPQAPSDSSKEPFPGLPSHPLNRWSTTSLRSMASLVAWNDGDDVSDHEAS